MIKRCLIGALAAALSFAWLTGCRKPNPLPHAHTAHRTLPASAQAQSPPAADSQASSLPGYAPNMLLYSGNKDWLSAYAMAMTRTDKGEWTAPKRFFTTKNSDAMPDLFPSPNGRRVALTSDVTGNAITHYNNDIFVYSFETRKLQRITYDNAGYMGVLWSSDSRYFACVGHSEWVKDRSRWTLYVYDVGKRAIKRVAQQVVTNGWGPVPGRLLFQKDGSLVLYEYDATTRRTLAVGRMPAGRFVQLLGPWAQVSNWPKAGQTYYRLVASRKGRQTTVRAVHWLNLSDSAIPYLLSPDGTRLILSGRRERPVILDLRRRTLRYFLPAPDRSYSVGWSSDGKAVMVYVRRIHEGPDKYPNARVYSVPLASLPESPIGRVDWERPHRPKLTLIKELGPDVQAMRWVGPGD